MASKIYYGKGYCNVEGNVSSLVIRYRGNIIIDSKLSNGYEIKLEKGKLNINTSKRLHNLNELFEYLGEFRILSVTGNNLEGDKELIRIQRVMDYSELLNTNAEDLTVKSENLSATYLHRIPLKSTRIKKIKGGKT